jgi:hypothetical protein
MKTGFVGIKISLHFRRDGAGAAASPRYVPLVCASSYLTLFSQPGVGGWHPAPPAGDRMNMSCPHVDIIKPAVYTFVFNNNGSLTINDCPFFPDNFQFGATVEEIMSWLLMVPDETHPRHQRSWNNLLKVFLWMVGHLGL